MRRILIFILFIAVCVYAYKYYNYNVIDYSMEEMIPQGSMVYLKIKNADKFFTEVSKNPVWKTLKTIDYEKLEKTTNVDLRKNLLIRLVNLDLTKDRKIDYLIRRFFSKEVSLAFYPPKEKSVYPTDFKLYMRDLIDQLISNVVVVSRMPFDLKLADIVSQIFTQYQRRLPTEIVPYRDYTYRTVMLPDLKIKLSFIRLKDFMAVAIGEDSIKRCIDTFINKENLLSKDKEFIRICKRHSRTSDVLGYFNIKMFSLAAEFNAKKIVEMIKNENSLDGTLSPEEKKGKELYATALDNKLNEVFLRLKGFRSIGLSINTKDITTMFFTLFFDKDSLGKNYGQIYSCQPSENESIYFIPKDIMGYRWDNCFDFNKASSGIKNNLTKMAAKKSVDNSMTALESSLNINLKKELVSAFGNEIGGYLRDIKMDKGFPLPDILFFVSIKNSENIEKVLNAIEKQPMLSFSEETYNEVKVKYLKTPFGDTFQPAYCFLNNYLLFGINPKLIKSSIDASSDKTESILDNENFKKVNFGLTGKNRKVQFVKMDALMDRLTFILKWGNNLISSKEKTRESFEDGIKKKLADINKEIFENNQEIKSMQNRIDILKKEFKSITSEEEIKSKEKEISFLQDSMETRDRTLRSLKDQASDAEKTLAGYNKNRGIGSQGRQILIDDFLNPVLTSLKSIKALGIKETSADDFYETSVYIESGK